MNIEQDLEQLESMDTSFLDVSRVKSGKHPLSVRGLHIVL
jgi:hypothetical protein